MGDYVFIDSDGEAKVRVKAELVDGNGDSLASNGAINVTLTGSIATVMVEVTPDDDADLADGATTGLYLGGTGNVKVDLAGGSTITLVGLAGGVIHPISVTRVHATGTTATNIVAVYA